MYPYLAMSRRRVAPGVDREKWWPIIKAAGIKAE